MIHRDDEATHYRDITKFQAPGQWPEPPGKNEESSGGVKPMNFSIEDFKYVEGKNYQEPSLEQLDALCEENARKPLGEKVSFASSLNTKSPYDNRTIVRILLWKRFKQGYLHEELYRRLLEPYDNGFYKKANGKSAPVFLKVIGRQRILGLRKDIVAVRHDFDYYLNEPKRSQADWYYLISQVGVGQSKIIAVIEYLVLAVFGGIAYRGHTKSQEWIKGYGTREFIPYLNDQSG